MRDLRRNIEHQNIRTSNIGGWRREARLEAGWRLEAGGWRLEAGGWRLEAGGRWTIGQSDDPCEIAAEHRTSNIRTSNIECQEKWNRRVTSKERRAAKEIGRERRPAKLAVCLLPPLPFDVRCSDVPMSDVPMFDVQPQISPGSPSQPRRTIRAASRLQPPASSPNRNRSTRCEPTRPTRPATWPGNADNPLRDQVDPSSRVPASRTAGTSRQTAGHYRPNVPRRWPGHR